MEHTQSDLTVEVREVPRSFPAILGALLAMAGIVYAESLVSWCLGRNSQPSLLLELPLLLVGGAITGRLAQFSARGSRLRLGRILMAVLTFNLALAFFFHMLGW
jgi:hypothetical protein